MSQLVNFWAILISMILSVVIGFIWYGPLFGKQWMELAGIKMPEEKPGMSVMKKPILLSLIGAFFMSFALSFSIAFHDAFYSVSGYMPALAIAFMLWLGFIVPVYFNFAGWEGKPWKLFCINVSYWLVFLLLSASVIVAFA